MFKPYKYVKEKPAKTREGVSVNIRRWVSVLLVAGGLFLISDQILVPWMATPPPQRPLLKPTSPEVAGARSGARSKIEVGFEFTELRRSPESDPESGVVERMKGTVPNNTVPTVFYVSIPKLGIERAEVDTNSESLSPDERLGHYPGSALPGEVGNTFIYGHSVLPMFYDPKNYRTIFSILDKLEEGDEVMVEFGEKYFRYVVEKSVVLNPEDVKPLEPIAPTFLRESYLTLMTCVPMGVGTNRLLVQAKLVL